MTPDFAIREPELAAPPTAYIFAEFCAGQFYWGWWLYQRETNDGKPNQHDPYDAWGWLRGTTPCSRQQSVNDLCKRIGYNPPPVKRHGEDFAEWFAQTFPNGLRVRIVDTKDRYELIEFVQKRPKQRRGAIRTIRGAAQAERHRSKAGY